MKTAKINFDFTNNNPPTIEGNFEFAIDNTITYSADDNLTPMKLIAFAWCPEIQQDLKGGSNMEDLAFEMYGELLKQDFINFLKNK